MADRKSFWAWSFASRRTLWTSMRAMMSCRQRATAQDPAPFDCALTQVLRSEKLSVKLNHVFSEQCRLTLKAADGGTGSTEALFQGEHEQIKVNY